MEKKLKRIARAGFVAKGTVYGITGILTFLAAFNLGGEKSSNLKVLEFLEEQPFGNALLILLGVGLICYALWRFFQSIVDPEELGDDTKGQVKRISFFISGILYLGLAGIALYKVITTKASMGTGTGISSPESSFFTTETGLLMIGLIGAGIAIAGFFQFLKAYNNDYTKKFNLSSIKDEKNRKFIEKSAEFGLAARGVVFLILGYFALRAAFSSNPSEIKSTSEVFSFIEDSVFGAWMLGAVAAGFVAYAVYMYLMAHYRRFKE